jgi:hypothetical protein
MAHQDGNGYYTKVVLVENGNAVPRRIQRLEWQGEDGRVHFLEGKRLPADLILFTGTGFKDNHFARFLGVKTTPPTSWHSMLPTKANAVYVAIGAALVIVLKGTLTLAAATF